MADTNTSEKLLTDTDTSEKLLTDTDTSEKLLTDTDTSEKLLTDTDTSENCVSKVYKNFSKNIKSLYTHISFINRLADPKYSLPFEIRKKYRKKLDITAGYEVEDKMKKMRKEARITICSGAYMNLFIMWEGFCARFYGRDIRKFD